MWIGWVIGRQHVRLRNERSGLQFNSRSNRAQSQQQLIVMAAIFRNELCRSIEGSGAEMGLANSLLASAKFSESSKESVLDFICWRKMSLSTVEEAVCNLYSRLHRQLHASPLNWKFPFVKFFKKLSPSSCDIFFLVSSSLLLIPFLEVWAQYGVISLGCEDGCPQPALPQLYSPGAYLKQMRTYADYINFTKDLHPVTTWVSWTMDEATGNIVTKLITRPQRFCPHFLALKYSFSRKNPKINTREANQPSIHQRNKKTKK